MTTSCMIIGLGQIGLEYDYDIDYRNNIYTHANAISVHHKYQLIGAVDLSKEQRMRFETRYKKPAFESVEIASLELKPDLIVVSTNSESHCTVIADVINFIKPKVILCEKPLEIDFKKAKSIVEICEAKGILLYVNYMRRADPGVLEIKKRILSSQIRGPIKANVWYSKGLLNNGSHFIDLISFWLGNINSVSVINSGRLWAGRDSEPDFVLELEGGSAFFRSAWEEKFTHYGVELLSPDGRLRYDFGGKRIEWQNVCVDPNFKDYKILSSNSEIIENQLEKYQWNIYEQLSYYIHDGKSISIPNGREALRTLEIINLINQQR